MSNPRTPRRADTAKRRSVPAESSPAPFDVDAVLAGDRAAFEELVRHETPRLYRVILRIVRDEEEARNVMQETFLQAYQRLGSFRGESKLTTWIYAIGVNLARSVIRKTSRYDTYEEADLERLQPGFSQGMYVQQYDAWDPQKMAERSDVRRIVREAIDRLPPDYRLVVLLRDIEQYSTAEAARLLDISEGALRVRLHRARQALRALLEQHFG